MELLDNNLGNINDFEKLDIDRRFIFGTGIYSQIASGLVEFSGFVEENPVKSELLGKPIRNLDSIPGGITVLVGSSLNPFSASAKLKLRGFRPLHLLFYLNERLSKKVYFQEFEAHFEEHKSTYDYLESVLEDEESRDLLKAIIEFRITGDINSLWGIKSPGEQYFEDFIKLGSSETFYDVGAFDGANSLRFEEITNGKGSILMFEANPKQHADLETSCSGNQNKTLVKYALSNRNTTLFFAGDKGSASRVENKATKSSIKVEARTLDSLNLLQAPTYIKLDVEGAEMQILNGGVDTIRRFRPNLAISVYHRPGDIAEAFTFCDRNLSSARYYLRQYTEGTDEIVLYCLPN